jgi:hypothetical protein
LPKATPQKARVVFAVNKRSQTQASQIAIIAAEKKTMPILAQFIGLASLVSSELLSEEKCQAASSSRSRIRGKDA